MASKEELNPDVNEIFPYGVVHTGHKYGNAHSVCTKYIVSTSESQVIVDGEEIYLNAERFNQENHADIVNKLFLRQLMAILVYQCQSLLEPILMILAILSWECDFLMENAKIVKLTLTKVSWCYIV